MKKKKMRVPHQRKIIYVYHTHKKQIINIKINLNYIYIYIIYLNIIFIFIVKQLKRGSQTQAMRFHTCNTDFFFFWVKQIVNNKINLTIYIYYIYYLNLGVHFSKWNVGVIFFNFARLKREKKKTIPCVRVL